MHVGMQLNFKMYTSSVQNPWKIWEQL